MATFERVDPDGDLNSDKSIFYVSDSSGGEVQLPRAEAKELMGWLRSFLEPLPSLHEKQKREQALAAYLERALRQIDHNHETGSMLVAGQVLAIVLTDLVQGTSDESIVKRLVDSWDHAVSSEQGPLMPKELTREAIRKAVAQKDES